MSFKQEHYVLDSNKDYEFIILDSETSKIGVVPFCVMSRKPPTEFSSIFLTAATCYHLCLCDHLASVKKSLLPQLCGIPL